jgi:hypothetical protein
VGVGSGCSVLMSDIIVSCGSVGEEGNGDVESEGEAFIGVGEAALVIEV